MKFIQMRCKYVDINFMVHLEGSEDYGVGRYDWDRLLLNILSLPFFAVVVDICNMEDMC